MEENGIFRLVQPKDPDTYVSSLILKYMQLFLRKKGKFFLALAGGKTPLRAYSLMSQRLKVKAFLSDERYVPLDDPRSNYKNIKDSGLEIFAFPTHLNITECAKAYSQLLPESLDVALLGIGEDGHTASLFPNTECQEVTKKVCISKSPDGLERLSLSYEYLNKSCVVLFYVKGKKQVIDRLLKGEPIPANKVKGRKKTLLVWSI